MKNLKTFQEEVEEEFDENDFLSFLYLQRNCVIGFKAANYEEEMTEELLEKYKKEFSSKIKSFILKSLIRQAELIEQAVIIEKTEKSPAAMDEDYEKFAKGFNHCRHLVLEAFNKLKS